MAPTIWLAGPWLVSTEILVKSMAITRAVPADPNCARRWEPGGPMSNSQFWLFCHVLLLPVGPPSHKVAGESARGAAGTSEVAPESCVVFWAELLGMTNVDSEEMRER